MSQPPLPSLADRLWDLSPRRVFEGLRRRLIPAYRPKPVPPPAWTRISQGALAGREIFVSQEDDPAWNSIRAGTYDADLFERLRKYSRPGGVLWDVGAHFGFHSLGFATLVGDAGRVVAFEPNPTNRARLHEHLARNPELGRRVEVVEAALSDRDGQTTFVLSDDIESGESSCSHVAGAIPPRPAGTFRKFREHVVSTVSIDSWIARHPDRVPDAIKLDVEGAEWLVFQGGGSFFAKHQPAVVMEVHDIRLLFHVQGFLIAHGYRMELLEEPWTSSSRCGVMAHPPGR